ncbi:MAG: methyltransferase FkbM [Bacteroidetes bacterium]|jgi:FkbM family methyltransferase|nr:methyltransferase FkbM [Bacteroidota bacterium]
MGLYNYSHPPEWLARNWLFRKLFLIRKLYLSKRKFSHYSQFAEDISIGRHFPKGYKGVFVDVGCFHPIKYNNTYKLYRRGWRGVNIDIDPIKIEGFDMARPGDVNIAAAVSKAKGKLDYWTNGFYSLTVTLDEDFAQRREGYQKRTVQADRLDNLLQRTPYAEQPIDFLTVDAEGHDLEVLQSLDFDTYAPRLIAVELHETTFDEVKQAPLYQFLESKNYVLANWVGLTLLLRRRKDDVLVEKTN